MDGGLEGVGLDVGGADGGGLVPVEPMAARARPAPAPNNLYRRARSTNTDLPRPTPIWAIIN